MIDPELVKWGATAFLAVGGILVSSSVQLAVTWWPYVFFLIGHLVWAVMAILINELSLLALNVILGAIDVYAIQLRLNNIGRSKI